MGHAVLKERLDVIVGRDWAFGYPLPVKFIARKRIHDWIALQPLFHDSLRGLIIAEAIL